MIIDRRGKFKRSPVNLSVLRNCDLTLGCVSSRHFFFKRGGGGGTEREE